MSKKILTGALELPLVLAFAIGLPQQSALAGESGQTTATTQPSQATSEEMRAAADAKWGKDKDFNGACELYDAAVEKFPRNVRIRVSLAAAAIDFAYQHADTSEGKNAYARARQNIQKALSMIDDATGEDIDSGSAGALRVMLQQIP